MEFSPNRGAQPAPVRAANISGGTSSTSAGGGKAPKSTSWKASPTWLRVVWVVLLFAITALLVAIAFLVYFGGNKEDAYINHDQEQAVFLTNGQVYFGRVKAINSDNIDLRGIYYLNVNQQVQPNQQGSNSSNNTNSQSVSLVKLGCELHGPVDQMVISRSQVTFWENLKSDGQVSKAIAQWAKQNPKGQDCTANANSNATNP